MCNDVKKVSVRRLFLRHYSAAEIDKYKEIVVVHVSNVILYYSFFHLSRLDCHELF